MLFDESSACIPLPFVYLGDSDDFFRMAEKKKIGRLMTFSSREAITGYT